MIDGNLDELLEHIGRRASEALADKLRGFTAPDGTPLATVGQVRAASDIAMGLWTSSFALASPSPMPA